MMRMTDHQLCDHGDCPAPAVSMLLIYGEDFYFCHHHSEELLLGDETLGSSLVAA